MGSFPAEAALHHALDEAVVLERLKALLGGVLVHGCQLSRPANA